MSTFPSSTAAYSTYHLRVELLIVSCHKPLKYVGKGQLRVTLDLEDGLGSVEILVGESGRVESLKTLPSQAAALNPLHVTDATLLHDARQYPAPQVRVSSLLVRDLLLLLLFLLVLLRSLATMRPYCCYCYCDR